MKRIYLKVSLALCAVVILSTNLSAQGAYMSCNFGYGFEAAPANAQDLVNTSIVSNNYTNIQTTEQIRFSLGNGLNLGAALGYMFNKNIGAELGANYLFGSKTEIHEDNDNGSNSNSYTLNSSISAKMFRIMPSIVLATGMEKFNPYAKFGVVISNGDITVDNTMTINGSKIISNSKINGDYAFGYTAAIGANYAIDSKLSVFSELSLISLSYSPTKGEVTESSVNGVSSLSSMTISQKQIDYVDSYTKDNNSPTSNSQPSQYQKFSFPLSSIGINVGVKYHF